MECYPGVNKNVRCTKKPEHLWDLNTGLLQSNYACNSQNPMFANGPLRKSGQNEWFYTKSIPHHKNHSVVGWCLPKTTRFVGQPNFDPIWKLVFRSSLHVVQVWGLYHHQQQSYSCLFIPHVSSLCLFIMKIVQAPYSGYPDYIKNSRYDSQFALRAIPDYELLKSHLKTWQEDCLKLE